MPDVQPPLNAKGIAGVLARSRNARRVLAVAVAVAALLAVLLAGDEIVRHSHVFESYIQRLGPWSSAAFVVVFVVATSLLIPHAVFSIAAGALFGLKWGMATIFGGSLLAAALQYGLSRRLLRRRIERLLASRPPLIAIQRAVLDDELRLQALLRLTPLNPATVSYMLGAAGVDFSKFLIACCAMAPNLLLELYLGHAGKNLAWAGAGDARVELQDFAIVVGLVAMLAVVLVISRMARKAVMQAVTESGENRSKGSPTLRDE